MSRQSLTKAHQKIQELSWEPTFATPAEKYKTDYTFEKAPKKDPLKQVLRSYFPMEEEKDNRVFGAMDGAIRGNMFPSSGTALDGMAKAVLEHHPVPRNFGGACDAALDRLRP